MGCGKQFTEIKHKTHFCYNCAYISDVITETCSKCYKKYECMFKLKLGE
jgi:hypothetical protein